MTALWTDDDIRLAWQLGYDYALGTQPVADAIDEIREAAPLAPAKPTSEFDRYLRRMAEMARYGAPEPWPGGATTRMSSYAHKPYPDAPDELAEFVPDPDGVLVLAGPVPWEGGPNRVPAWLHASAERNRRHDTEMLQLGLKTAPISDWRQVHASVSPTVWARIWGDLCDGERRQIADLDPRQPARTAAR